jgi:hypothetical protein
VINEKTTVTNKERSPEENSVRGPLGSRGTELYRVVRILRFWPTAADYILLIYPGTGASYLRTVLTVQRNN